MENKVHHLLHPEYCADVRIFGDQENDEFQQEEDNK